MKLVGLTGGAGSGKSTVAGMLRELGAVVVDADEATHAVYEPGTPGFDAVVREFGSEFVSDGRIDRALLDAALDQITQGAVPELVGLSKDVLQVRVARRAQDQLAHHRPELLIGLHERRDCAEVATQLFDRRTLARHRLGETLHGVADDAADQCLFRWKVVMEGGDVDAGVGGDVACTQPFEAVAGDALVGGGNERAASIGSRLLAFINHLIGL